ncbi:YALI0A19822p [Yarrowia lipolytica CLIB122]|uniref:YALI0A19822p n=2 Tax=Yarrowia lipolytica TaxID=4952 RepID=Q6CGF3_YARLI|nr:YALI0A19822p [Yarrowia lipolytica CLIB122]KAJ8051850.1 hypothetical protein LXG23DRAFT_51365 [Yarrowia lipolytica]CAG84197.1 YALI0A19822p [Yarrowia lipolytica CLIB122]|eukprot:XP_500259.1 YALI0A19822p [Yarrowia lipolytica CLIB122]
MDVEPVSIAAEPRGNPEDEDILLSGPILREEAVNLRGVNEMSNKDVKSYVSGTCSISSVFNIDWVDDSSVNIVFVDAIDAQNALQAMTDPSLFYDGDSIEPEQERAAKTFVKADHGKVQLQVRTSYQSDVKARDARQKSKYYLYHGEPTKVEDFRRFQDKAHTYEVLERRRNLKPSGRSEIDGEDLFPSVTKRDDESDEEDLIRLSSRSRGRRSPPPIRRRDRDIGRWEKDPSLIEDIEMRREQRGVADLFEGRWGNDRDSRDNRSLSPVSRMREGDRNRNRNRRDRSTSPWRKGDRMDVDDQDIRTRLDLPRESRSSRQRENQKRERRRDDASQDIASRLDTDMDGEDNKDLASRFQPRDERDKGGRRRGGGRRRAHELFG